MGIKTPWRAILIAIGINALWGGNAVAVKLGLSAIPPLWTGFWRFLLGIVFVLGWAGSQQVSLWPKKGEWKALIALAVLFFVQIALMNWGIDLSTAVMSTLLIQSHPFFVTLFTYLTVPQERLTFARIAGLSVAFSGLIWIMSGGDITSILEQANWIGSGVLLLNAALLGGRITAISHLVKWIHPDRVTLWQMVLTLPFFGLGGWYFEHVNWEQMGWVPVLGIAYQGIVIAGLCFVTMAHLVKKYNPGVITSFNFVAPISGVILSAVLVGDQIGPEILVGMIAIASGLAIITWGHNRQLSTNKAK